MAINDYSLAAMQQIAKLISDSAAQDTASVRDSLAYMSMIHGIKMDKEKWVWLKKVKYQLKKIKILEIC